MKYIVDIDVFDTLFKVDSIGVFGIGKSVDDSEEDHSWSRIKSIEEFEELTADYINEHFGDLQDTAYQRGLDEAWEAARKIVEMPDPPYWEVFDEYKDDLFGKITASEAIEKLKAYEEKQKADDKIEVGDEVIYNGTTKCLVVRPETDERYALLIDGNGHHHSADHRECKKTGRHFDIKSILEEMRND